MTRVKAFRHFGTKPKNPYRSLSARSADGGAVAVSLWKDKLQGPTGRLVYWLPGWGDWNRHTARPFFEDLEWAVAKCGGEVNVVLVVQDPKATPKTRTVDCYPVKNWAMRVTYLDSATGTFRLEQFDRRSPRNEAEHDAAEGGERQATQRP